jgi:hypothetical protein
MADEKDTPQRRPAAQQQDTVRMDLMEQAKALQFLAAQAAADAMRLPDQRLDEMHDEPMTQVFERVGPDGKVISRVNANGEEVKKD